MPVLTKKLLIKNFLHLFFEKSMFVFFNKTNIRRIINLFTFLNQLKLGLLHSSPLTLFFFKPTFVKLLKLLRREYLILNYFIVPKEFFPSWLQSQIEKRFLKNFICVLFRAPNSNFFALKPLNLFFISKPSRSVFINYKQLVNLTIRKNSQNFILSTCYGFITHREALQYKIGGILLLRFS